MVNNKLLSNPFSTGGGGGHFEAHIQASFVVLMLSGGYAPCLPCWPISKIKLQGKVDGFDTDDLVVTVENPDTKEGRKLLGQVKHRISFTKSSPIFAEVIQSAWSDFNNPRLFTKEKDIIALLTGPLSATDYHTVQWLLKQSRHTNTHEEFFRNVEQANFSPPGSSEKLSVIEDHLKLANGNLDVSRETLYSFLRHFHLLGYDLGTEYGVMLSLLHSHISQFNTQTPSWIWSRVVDIVQTWNQDAGTITRNNIPQDLLEAFKHSPSVQVQIPAELAASQSDTARTEWGQHEYASKLAQLNLIGAWNEKRDADLALLQSMTDEPYSSLAPKARKILLSPGNPLSLRNGLWRVAERLELWSALGPHIFDQDLDTFKAVAVEVLTERDPVFELAPRERFAASIHGKVLKHSVEIRKGIAEGLALLGSSPEVLVNCTQGKARITSVLTIREIFENADWMLWGSLNNLLPVLAEAAPNEFLDAVEHSLGVSPCPFDELFSQEGDGFTGGNYLTGLLWALENLAWDETYLVRVSVILSELASHDPGGNWANRPSNSLQSIFLPWYPQTTAPIEKRKVAVQTVCNEWPAIGWKLLIGLLPNQHQTTSGTHKPVWRNPIHEDWKPDVSNQDYWEQVSFYAELAVSMAESNYTYLVELIDNFDNLTKNAFDRLLGILSSQVTSSYSEEQRFPLWDNLRRFTTRHRRFSDAKWALDDELLSAIETVTLTLIPSTPLLLYRHLFSGDDFSLYEERGNWEEQDKKIELRRQSAIEEILRTGGTSSIVQLAESSKSPRLVGYFLGRVRDADIDAEILPKYLETDSQNLLDMARGYVGGSHYTNGWQWVDELDTTEWSQSALTQLLCCLPFSDETWRRVTEWLKEAEDKYWSLVAVHPFQSGESLEFAVDKLVAHGRPLAAISCLYGIHHAKQPLDVAQCVRALLAVPSSQETINQLDRLHIVEIIKFLQTSTYISSDDLFQIEWAYLPLFDHDREASPKFLESRLSSNPEFFCEVLQLVYRSKKEEGVVKEPSEQTRNIAQNAMQLLDNWQTLPGVQDSGFDADHFINWLDRVKNLCDESGRLEVALLKIGEALIHSPGDADGLWINRSVAEALNARDADPMRRGFRTALFNSRGAHTVDPSGKPERDLAEKYRRMADDVENEGFQRLAVVLRELADDYDRWAERIIAEHAEED